MVYILGVNIAETNLQKACQKISEWIDNKEKKYVCIAPASTIVDCQENESYKKVINSSGMTTPDGMPLVWIGKAKGVDIERTYGPDLLQAMNKLSEDKGYRNYFYGGTQESIELFVSKMKEMYPKLNIVGSVAPPIRKINEIESDETLSKINEAKPDILWVGLGSPKQDFWMYNHREKLDASVIIGVGAAFDFLAGIKKQAPVWMQRSGLEWFFRLCSEPKRLWRRYLIGNSKFIFYLLRDCLVGKKRGKVTNGV